MSEKLLPTRSIYPLIALAAAVVILVCGLLTAKYATGIIFLAGCYVLFLVFGYWRACLAILPFAFIVCLILAGITYLISHDLSATMAAVNRILAVCIAVIPGLGMRPADMVRSFSSIGVPRMLTLAMMITLTFFPLLAGEVRQIREAMKTRGAGSIWSPGIFYRAFLIPLMMRLIGISDTLALSVETRGFSADGEHTEYRVIRVKPADIIFAVILILGAAAAIVFRT